MLKRRDFIKLFIAGVISFFTGSAFAGERKKEKRLCMKEAMFWRKLD